MALVRRPTREQDLGPQPLGSHVEIERTRRPVKQYAVLETDLGQLAASSLLTSTFGAFSSYYFSFSASCWVALQGANTSALDPLQVGRLTMGQEWGSNLGKVFAVLAVLALGWGGALIWQIRRTSTPITVTS